MLYLGILLFVWEGSKKKKKTYSMTFPNLFWEMQNLPGLFVL